MDIFFRKGVWKCGVLAGLDEHAVALTAGTDACHKPVGGDWAGYDVDD